MRPPLHRQVHPKQSTTKIDAHPNPTDAVSPSDSQSTRRTINIAMKLLRYLARVFINTFGITQPTAKEENQAAWFIGALLIGLLVVFGAVITVAVHFVRR